MHSLKSYFAGLCLLTLSACATTQGGSSYGSAPASATMYGEYLAASYASYTGDAAARSDYYSRAFARRADDLALGRKAMVSALKNGDEVLARALAIEVGNLDATDGLSRAIMGAHALQKGQYQKAITYLENGNDGTGFENVNAIMRGWAHNGLGQNKEAFASFNSLVGGRYFSIFGDLQTGIYYGRTGQTEKADEAFDNVKEYGISAMELTLAHARSLASRGDIDGAVARLATYTEKNGAVLLGPAASMSAALKAGTYQDPDFSPAQMASRALSEQAFEFYAASRQYDVAEMFLRIALSLDPENDKALLFLGTVLEELSREDEAALLYAKIDPASDYAVTARLSEVNLLFDDDKHLEGIAILEHLHADNPSRSTRDSLGRAHLILEDYENALPYYDAMVNNMSLDEQAAQPRVLYLRGICLERLGRWQEAVTDFQFVLKHDPDNADTLNYLGYTWIDKGVNLTQAFTMINKAVALEPESGAIIDSLGWAHYKLGQYGQARIKLEDAAARAPASATIIDHLGDVYWKLGRRREAGYQWERALTLDPTDKEALTIKAKLSRGLGSF